MKHIINNKRRYLQSELYFEEIGSRFDNWMSPYDVDRRIVLIKKLMPIRATHLNCLEVGCGTVKISEVLAPIVKALTVSDISENLAKDVGERLGVKWMKQDACRLDIPNESFHMVISSECIEHTPNPNDALIEIARVVKRGGFIIITSPNKLWSPLLWLSMVSKIRKFAGNENWLFLWKAVSILRNSGINEMRVGGCHLYPWQIPFAKHVLPIFDRFDSILYPVMVNYGICGKKT